jgi:hypothetical protein
MGFLDNLENSLKSLESQEERDGNQARRQKEHRDRELAAAPWAERLRSSDYTKDLLDQAAAAGHRLRTKIYMAWFDSTLRLEARGRVLELKPTPEGIVAEFVDGAGERSREVIDLQGAPVELLNRWLESSPNVLNGGDES